MFCFSYRYGRHLRSGHSEKIREPLFDDVMCLEAQAP